MEAFADEPEMADILRVDLQAVYDRDPACNRYIEPIFYFKGFHAIQTHRLANPGEAPLEIIEVQSGSYLGEDDIVRFDDSYGRD